MQAKLIFNLPEERQEFKQAINANNLCSFIWEFEQRLRKEWKYPSDDVTGENWEGIEKAWELWHEVKEEEIPNFHEIWS